MNTVLRFRYFTLALVTVFAVVSCNQTNNRRVVVQRGFYFWKDNESYMKDGEHRYIDSLHIRKLYVKFFELEKDEKLGMIVPAAKSGLRYVSDSFPEIIPVIMIKNEALKNVSRLQLDTLADNILFLTDKHYEQRFSSFHSRETWSELQVDCDWTAGTKDNYFYLLQQLKRKSKKKLSCTLRLYPYKYPGKMGVPPVDRAMLMCYNLVNPLKSDDKNSILDIPELRKYVTGNERYPVPLDVALPAYSWMQCYQNNVFTGVLYNEPTSLEGLLKPIDRLWYEVQKDTVIGDRYLRAGDRLKYEKITVNDLEQAVDLLKQHVHLQDTATLTFFHLDQDELSFINYATLDSLYSNFAR